MPTGQLVVMLMRDVMRVPYDIDPDVLADRKPRSVNLQFPRSELPVRVVHFLRSIGLQVELDGGTVFVRKRPPAQASIGSARTVSVPSGLGSTAAIPIGNPLVPRPAPRPIVQAPPAPSIVAPEPPIVEAAERVAVVRPAHIALGELAGIYATILPELSIAARSQVAPVSSTAIGDEMQPDSLVIRGTAADLDLARAIVNQVDRPRPVVSVRAVIFEVRKTDRNATALSALASVLGDRVQLGAGDPLAAGDTFLRIAAGGISAVLAATSRDGRFEVVAEPSILALSGTSATLNSGSQVPTIGQVTYTDEGAPIRSIEYRDSGVTLTVAPIVRAGAIELRIEQERSSFASTDSGVNETPTLNRSASSTTVALQPGETLAIGGLDESSSGNQRSKLLLGLLSSKARQKDEAQLLLLVQADLLPNDRPGSASFDLLGDGDGAASTAKPLAAVATPSA